jgi:hypothetical protein
MKDRILHIVISVGFICLLIFTAIRIPSFFNMLVKEKVIPEYWENTPYGELYNFNRIEHFKEDLPPATIKYRYTPKQPEIKEADILTFGDSFFDFARITTFPERLGDTLNKRIYFARYDYPLNTLAQNNYPKGTQKLLIYETAERYIPVRFSKPQVNTWVPDTRGVIRKSLANARDKLFIKDSEVRYSLLLTRSYLTEKLYAKVATLKFDMFGYIAETTPVYALNQPIPWLFYYEEVNEDVTSFYYQHSEEDIARYCDNIADLRMKLKNEYNLDMVFMPVPCKYTVYHKFVNQHTYNNLLPRIYKGLEKRDVPFVRLYDDFINSKEILYYGTDTHWNPKGLDMALRKTVDCIKDRIAVQIALDSIHSMNNPN